MRAIRCFAIIGALIVAACGGDGASDADITSTVAEVGTTVGETTTTVDDSDDNGSAGLDEMPQECIDALAGYLQAIEPTVEGVDFDNATAEDLEALGSELEEVSEEYATSIEALDCPDPEGSEEEAFDAILALAESEAPGTVPYLEWIRSFASSVGDVGESASGDCETDITALETLIDEKGSMSNLTMGEVVEVGGLVSSITTNCSPERAEEFLGQEKVTTFLEG